MTGLTRKQHYILENNPPDRVIPDVYIVDDNHRYFSENNPNQWLQVQFNIKVKINSYMMKYPSGWSYCPSNFVLEISLNGTEWKEVDQQNKIDFTGKDFKENFTNSFDCTYIRIRNIGKNINGYDQLVVLFLEFFGYAYE